jgi:hypothetical protein
MAGGTWASGQSFTCSLSASWPNGQVSEEKKNPDPDTDYFALKQYTKMNLNYWYI